MKKGKTTKSVEPIIEPIKAVKVCSALDACGIIGVTGRMRIVVERKFKMLDKRSYTDWVTLFKTERIID